MSPWNNTWVPYWTRYIESRGHEVKWLISQHIKVKDTKEFVSWADKILCHWADKYAIVLTDPSINTKPLYVILRSYEIFSADGWADLGLIRWDNIKQLFMLNEAHLHPFHCRVNGVNPIFIKNGIDVDEWIPQGEKNPHKIAWICNLNEKKGVELVVQAIHELNKVNNVVLEHIGQNQDIRRWYYLEQVMPRLNTRWYNSGYKNSHDFVKEFLKDKGFIISTSIAEGNPMNIIEAMASGVIPLVHTWPGSEHQFPKECLWTTFDDLREIYRKLSNDADASDRMREFAVKKYDYRVTYKPVVDVIERE